MTVNLEVLDAKIRRLQKLRELLTDSDTRELLNDPETIALIQQSRNGGVQLAFGAPIVTPPSNGADYNDESNLQMPAEGSFRKRVLDIAQGTSKFDARFIYEKLRQANHQFEASDPMIAINTALRALQGKSLIRLVRAGSGRQPHIYEAVRMEESRQ